MTNEQRAALRKDAMLARIPQEAVDLVSIYEGDSYQQAYEGLRIGMEYAKRHMEQNQWVPVTERLPNPSLKTWDVTMSNGDVATSHYHSGSWRFHYTTPYSVIAWRERPAPYSPPKAENNG